MLEGDLSDFTLPDILRLLAFTAKTGRLRIDGDRSEGRVDLVDGRVRDASADAKHLPLARRLIGLGHTDGDTLTQAMKGRETLPTDLELARELVRATDIDEGLVTSVLREQTVDALFDLLRWERGSFRFEVTGDADGAPPALDLKVDDLLAEADQRLDAWPSIEQRTGSGNAVVSISRPDGGTPDIDADGWGLLGLVDGHRTVDDLVALLGRGQFETRRQLGALVDLGVVSVGAPGRGGAVERLIEQHRTLARLESALSTGGDEQGSRGGTTPRPEPARADRPVPQPSAQRTDAGAWPQRSAPEDLPPPTGAPDEPSFGAGPGPSGSSGDPGGQHQASPADPAGDDESPLRMRVRSDRLTTDPSIDADLVTRLIDGVEGL